MLTWLSQVEHCQLYGKPWLVLFTDLGDLFVFASYAAIPVAILNVMARRDMKLHKFKLAGLFAAFIVLCGVGHLIDVLTLHWGSTLPWLNDVAAAETALTGIVSVITAAYCFKLIPLICRIPSYDEHVAIRNALAMFRETEFWTNFGHNFGQHGGQNDAEIYR